MAGTANAALCQAAPKMEAANVFEREYGILTEIPAEGFGIEATADYLGLDLEQLITALRDRRILGLPQFSANEHVRFSQSQIDLIAEHYDEQLSVGFGSWALLASKVGSGERRRLLEDILESPEP